MNTYLWVHVATHRMFFFPADTDGDAFMYMHDNIGIHWRKEYTLNRMEKI